MAAALLDRIRYFTDGAVIGSKAFVNAAFANARARFGSQRGNGARERLGGGVSPLRDMLLWRPEIPGSSGRASVVLARR